MPETPIKITLNGTPRTQPPGTTVAALLASMGLSGRRVAVEINGELAPRAGHAARSLAAGDVVEVVTIVGGG